LIIVSRAIPINRKVSINEDGHLKIAVFLSPIDGHVSEKLIWRVDIFSEINTGVKITDL
jgi:hypothetical protein